jgi:hypothetical protein
VLGALIYPALVTLIAALVVGALVFYVIPQVVAVYQQSRQSLPWLTRSLIAFTGFARETGGFWVFGAVLATIAGAFALKVPRWREAAQRWLIEMPVVGPLAVAIDSARFSSPDRRPRCCARSTRRRESSGCCLCDGRRRRRSIGFAPGSHSIVPSGRRACSRPW